jgi:hypothetical protein
MFTNSELALPHTRTTLSGAAHLAVKQNFQAFTIFVCLLLLVVVSFSSHQREISYIGRQNPVASRPCALQLCTHTHTSTGYSFTLVYFFFSPDDYRIVIIITITLLQRLLCDTGYCTRRAVE